MIENNAQNNGPAELDIDFGKIFQTLRKNRKTLAKITACGFVLGCILALNRPHKYEVVSKIAPELSAGTANRLSTIAAMAGLSAATMGMTDAIYPMVYPDLVKSPDFIAGLFDTPVTFEYRGKQVDTTLYAYYTGFQRFSLLGSILSLPVKLFNLDKEEADDVISEVDPFCFTKKQGRVYKAINRSINAEIDKRTLIVTIRVTMRDKVVCAEVARALNELLKKTIISYRTQKAVVERDYYAELLETNRLAYYEAQGRYAHYSDSHQNSMLQSVLTEKDRLRNDISLQSQIYNNTAVQLQSAEAKILQDTPAFAEIVKPSVPLIPKDSRKRFVIVFTFLVFCIASAWILAKEI